MNTLHFASVIALFAMLTAACSHPLKNTAVVESVPRALAPTQQEYRIQPGDMLEVKFYYNPELNELMTVRPDGRISLQLAPEIVAAGRTPAELTRELKEKYVDLDNPEIAVMVRSFSGQRVFVDGEVTKAGVIHITGPLTVIEAISLAGGAKESARLKEVLVLHRDAYNKVTYSLLNLEKAYDGTDTSQDIYLKPSDIVYVPKSDIANVGQWVDQYFRRLIPFPFGVGAQIF